MKKMLLILCLFIVGTLLAQTPANDPNWHLLWQDNFNGTQINTNKWLIRNNFDHYKGDSTNGIGGYYKTPSSALSTPSSVNSSNNVTVSNGQLKFKIKYMSGGYSCPTNALNPWGCSRQKVTGSHYQYTIGWVESQPLYYMQYGYVEARIKLSAEDYLHNSFWTFTGQDYYQEIDIFEMVPGGSIGNSCNNVNEDENIMTNSVHFKNSEDACLHGRNLAIQDYTQWHTYGIEWSPSRIIYLN